MCPYMIVRTLTLLVSLSHISVSECRYIEPHNCFANLGGTIVEEVLSFNDTDILESLKEMLQPLMTAKSVEEQISYVKRRGAELAIKYSDKWEHNKLMALTNLTLDNAEMRCRVLSKIKITIMFNGNFTQLNSNGDNFRQAAISAIAAVMQIDKSFIHVLRVFEGSVGVDLTVASLASENIDLGLALSRLVDSLKQQTLSIDSDGQRLRAYHDQRFTWSEVTDSPIAAPVINKNLHIVILCLLSGLYNMCASHSIV